MTHALALLALAALPLLAAADTALSSAAFAATNDYRRTCGATPLRESPSMYARCMEHSRGMAAAGRVYHTSLGGGVGAENVAMRSAGGDAAGDMVRQWIGSSGHEKNMRGPYACGATALHESGGSVWGTQMFGSCSDGVDGHEPTVGEEAPQDHAPAEGKDPDDYAPVENGDRREAPAQDSYDAETYAGEYHGANERCQGAEGHPAVAWRPCAEALVCVSMPQMGYGKFCVAPRWEGDHDEEYGEERERPTGGYDA